MPIRTFAYGLLEPIVNAKLVHNQMWLAHKYHNVLVEIEHERRQKAVAALAAHVDVAPIEQKISELEPLLEAAKQVILRTRSASRSRSDTAAQRHEVKDLAGRLRALRAERKAARKAIVNDPVVRAALDAVDEGARERVRQARKVCGVYWGTYLLHEADIDRARQGRMPPKFASWNGHIARRVSVQLQGGLELENLWGQDTQIQIVPGGTHGRKWDGSLGTTLRLRVGSEGRSPIFAEWPVFVHRPIPDGSVIKVATVSCFRRSCSQWTWTLHLTVDSPTSIRTRPAGVGDVALNLGFCLRPDGAIRSGYVVGYDGHEEEVLVPKRDIEAFEKADSIRSFRDKNMDAMRAQLLLWANTPIGQRPADDHEVRDTVESSRRDLPDWFREKAQYLYAWRSPERFRGLMGAWRNNRFEGDEVGFKLLETWWHRDRHLDQYENGLRRSARLRRREGYRCLAAKLATKYHTIVIDDTNLSTLQRSPDTESTDVNILVVKHQQRLAAGSELRGALLNAFDRRVETLSAVNMTRRHESCGHVDMMWDRTKNTELDRHHTCPSCHVTFDQDANHCRNLLRERSGAMLDRETARNANQVISKPTRQQRLRGTRVVAAE